MLWKMATKMITTNMDKSKAFRVFFIIDFGIVLFCILTSHYDWLINTQIAFASSLMVTIGSYLGYQANIEKRVPAHSVENDDPNDTYDELDKMDDKYDLYSNEVIQSTITEEPTKEDIQDAMKPIKQNHFSNFKSGFSGMASLYRIFGYVGLVVGFFYLKNNGFLEVYSYIFGFIIVPLSSLALSFSLRNR